MKWLEIGTYTLNKKNQLVIGLHEGYGLALTKLDLFSHCMLVLLLEEAIDIQMAKIVACDVKQSTLLLETIGGGEKIKGQLVDIKPYYPNEEVIKGAKQVSHRSLINYAGEIVGTYKIKGSINAIYFEAADFDHNDATQNFFNQVVEGDFLRVIWWFHRFDKDAYRKNRLCHPPYNNAPKSGIFATRSPVRPNPVASTVVKVTKVNSDNKCIEIQGFDGFSGTKILQVMLYDPKLEQIDEVQLPPWVDHWTRHKDFKAPKKIDVSSQRDIGIGENGLAFECSDLAGVEDIEAAYIHNEIHIKNASIHNLKNVSVHIPKNEITLITGVSGSGKSSLAFDTLFAESQRHFMDLVLSNDMASDLLADVHVEKISGLQPAIAIKQKNMGSNPRSTVGSTTKIAELVKLLFVTLGQRKCPNCHQVVDASNVCGQCGTILFDPTPQMFSYNHPDYMCPVCKGLGVEMQIDDQLIVEKPHLSLLDKASSFYGDLRKHRKKPNANWMRGEVLALANDLGVDLELPYNQLPEKFRQEFLYGSNGREVSLSYQNTKGRSGVITRPVEGAVHLIHRLLHDSKSSTGLDNMRKYMSKKTCSRCEGERLLEEGRLVHIKNTRYPEVMKMSVGALRKWCHLLYRDMTETDCQKSRPILQKINARLLRIESVGLPYISLDRSIPSLSGGEAQRLKLATQFGTGLSNILYIMDEPSKGLHPKDYSFLMEAIEDLKNHGNTVVLVEHKEAFKAIADTHIVMGPKAGHYGGQILHVQPKEAIVVDRHEEEIVLTSAVEGRPPAYIEIKGAETNNLKSVNVRFPIGKLTAVIGVSGSGKSSLIGKTLYPYVETYLGDSVDDKGQCETILGLEEIRDVSYVHQKPIGSNSRSNPATYTGVFDDIRKCYSQLSSAKDKGFGKDFFSFNAKKGQCPTCKGMGQIPVNMHYMDDIFVPCNSCQGKRYTDEVLDIKRKGYSIGDVLDMEIVELLPVFKEEEEIYNQLKLLEKVGLGYLKLGQSAANLSGGEAQRIKLAKELYKKNCGGVLYILDEPTTGLHAEDTKKIIQVLRELNEKGATIIIIEHNMTLIKACDYAIELGPSGGDMGGSIVREGYIYRTD